jgi:hypothetical protein
MKTAPFDRAHVHIDRGAPRRRSDHLELNAKVVERPLEAMRAFHAVEQTGRFLVQQQFRDAPCAEVGGHHNFVGTGTPQPYEA